MIPEDTIAEIRARSDIVAVIGAHVQLRKAGRSYKGLCPFHGEKSPSFHVSPERGAFYCFGCHKKGDVFSFVMEFLGKSFVEAAEQLAAAAGIDIPEQSRGGAAPRTPRAAMLAVNQAAMAAFAEALRDPRAQAARAYLETRGIDAPTIERFALGYAPALWTYLGDKLKSQGVDLELAAELGLVGKRDRGGYYDRFRERLMCPVMITGGDVMGFSGRYIGNAAPEPDKQPPAKYINSPESSLYKKSRLLFGLAQAREGIAARKRAILVEGNFDVITMHQAGFTETVAPLGTALTDEQIEQLRRLTDHVVLCYDGDSAGKKATLAAIEACVAADVPVTVVALPAQADPDSLIKEQGAPAMQALLARAQPGIEFFALEMWGKSAQHADARAQAIEAAARLIARMTNTTRKELVIDTLATALQVKPELIVRAAQRSHGTSPASGHPGARPGGRGPDASTAGTGTPHPSAAQAPRVALPTHEELELLALLGQHPELVGRPEANEAVSLLTDSRLRDMYSQMRAGHPFEDAMAAHLPGTDAMAALAGLGRSHAPEGDKADPTRRLAQHVGALRRRAKHHEMARIQTELKAAQQRGDLEQARRLGEQIVALRKQVD